MFRREILDYITGIGGSFFLLYFMLLTLNI